METLIGYDSDLFLWLNSFNNSYWDAVMSLATGKVVWFAMYASIIFALWKAYGPKTAVIFLIFCFLVVLSADQITASILRPVFGRLRPSHLENPISPLVHIVDGNRGGSFGFPSSHAANTFGVATLLSLIFRKTFFTVSIFLWALINCYSRIYLGLHYPGDLLFGMLIGTICGLVAYFIAIFILRFSHLKYEKWQKGTFIYIGGKRVKYIPSDVVIYVEMLTILFIFLFAFSTF